MPGVASISNSSTNGESINLYFTTQTDNLGLSLQPKDPDGPHETFSSGPDDHQGIIENPSHIGAAQYLGINFVVGITQPVPKPGGTTDNLHDVSVVSPVFQPLQKTEKINGSISISSSGQAAWVYFLRGTDADSLKLLEYNINTEAPLSELGTTKLQTGSTLAAYWNPDTNKRYVIYQDAISKNLYEYCVNDENAEHIKNSTDARPGTAMAVTYNDKKAYAYYSDGSYEVRKVVKTDGEWGTSSGIDGSAPLDESSLMTVTTTNKVNHIFYLQQGSTGEFSHVRDQANS